MFSSKKATNFWILVKIHETFRPSGSYSVLSVSRVSTRASSVSAKIAVLSAKSRLLIVASPNDIPQSIFPTFSPITQSIQVLKIVGARTHPCLTLYFTGKKQEESPQSSQHSPCWCKRSKSSKDSLQESRVWEEGPRVIQYPPNLTPS